MVDKKPKNDGLRIQLKGLRSMHDLRAMLHLAVDELEALPITHARGINLYLTPADKEANPVYPRKNRRPVADITIEEPYRSAADEHGL